MAVRLAGGVVPGPGRRVFSAEPDDDPGPGAPVVVGPRSAAPETALASLGRLVRAGGVLAAGADVDLGGGFRSARTDGAAGDRRDAVLAALAVPEFAGRLGPPAAVLVALFGPSATKPLGAAAQVAVAEERWAVLRYAAAASDVLGPEQLVRLLDLRVPESVDPFPRGLPSVVGRHLGRVLRNVSGPRRLALLTDLWERVCADGAAAVRQGRLAASQGRVDRADDLRERYRRYVDDELVGRAGPHLSVADALRYRPESWYWIDRLDDVLVDAQCATVLARVAVSAVDHGPAQALARHRAEIAAAADRVPKRRAAAAARIIPGLTGLPARPGSYVRDLHRVADQPLDGRTATYVTQRLARARDYGTVVLWAVENLLIDIPDGDSLTLRELLPDWSATALDPWRAAFGYLSPERLTSWDVTPLWSWNDDVPPLPVRLREHADRPPAEVETVGDLLWFAELADALAQLGGHPAARLTETGYGILPAVELAPRPDDGPLTPRTTSVAVAAAGTAQLVDLGGRPPARCRTWPELVAGLFDGAAVAAALTGHFDVPAGPGAADGTVLPGTDARIEVARTGRQVAEWAAYMGNCIAGRQYTDAAASGRAVLVALRAPDGRILANVDLRPTPHGWRIDEIRARFNEDPDPVLLGRTRQWVAGLGAEAPGEPAPDVDPEPGPRPRGRRPTPAARTARELGAELGERLTGELAAPDAAWGVEVAGRLAGTGSADPFTELRRATPATLLRTVRDSVAGGGLAALWWTTSDRPLARAVAATPGPDRLAPLLADQPLPGSLRTLARLPDVAPARTRHLVALRLRAALGELLRRDAPELADAVAAEPFGPLVRAAALTVTGWGGTGGAVTVICPRRRIRVPGYPATTLRDDLWQSAWPDAVDLGADPDAFWPAVAAHGLLMPSSWLPAAGWPALWSRAARREHR